MKIAMFCQAQALAQGSRGGFAARLADAWFAADSHNKARIEAAFPDLFKDKSSIDEVHALLQALGRNDAIEWVLENCEQLGADFETTRQWVLGRG